MLSSCIREKKCCLCVPLPLGLSCLNPLCRSLRPVLFLFLSPLRSPSFAPQALNFDRTLHPPLGTVPSVRSSTLVVGPSCRTLDQRSSRRSKLTFGESRSAASSGSKSPHSLPRQRPTLFQALSRAALSLLELARPQGQKGKKRR